MFNYFRKIFGVITLLVAISACAAPATTPISPTQLPDSPVVTITGAETSVPAPGSAQKGEQPVLTIMTHDSFAITDALVKQFEDNNHVKLSFIKGGDAGVALNKAILSKENLQADVFYGVDNTLLSRALKADIFDAYLSPVLKSVSPDFDLDSTHRLLPVDYGDVCINYDIAYFKSKGLKVPASLDDLVKPEYKGLLVVENPATSSTGLAFLFSTVAQYGPDKFLDYWKQLKANDVVVADGWEAAYYTQFSGSSGKGPQPMVVSYGTSPAAEMVFAKNPLTEVPTASIISANACFRQVEFVGILKGTKQVALAEKWVDFMLSKTFQEDIPLQMFVFPVNKEAALPDAFTKYIQMPDKPAQLAPDQIDVNRDTWIEAWRGMMLK